MKKRFVSLLVSVAIVMSAATVYAKATVTYSAFSIVSVDFPEGESMNWSERRILGLQYADTKEKIPPDEVKKIDYAKKFFESLERDLKDIKVSFQTRINKQKLIDILKEVL